MPLKAYIFSTLDKQKIRLKSSSFESLSFVDLRFIVDLDYSDIQIPSLAESLCLPCPPGAECPGGANVVPLEGFWAVSRTEKNGVQRRAEAAIGVEVRRRRINTMISYIHTKFSHDIRNLQVVRCPPGACLGNGTCSEGRTGPVCGLCM